MRDTVSPVSDLTADESARRCRAAWAYAALDQSELAARAEIHKDRFRRLIARSNPDRASIEEMRAIASATNVPGDFMEHGWDITRWQSPDTVAHRLEQLADAVDRLQQELDADVGALQAAMIEVRQRLGMPWRPDASSEPMTTADRGH
jgi:hypothetical protein